MSKAYYYQIYVRSKPGITREKIKKKMDLALDWYRYSDECWIVYTTSDAHKWYERLSPLVKAEGYVLIVRLDISDRQGWMPKGFWAWIKKHNQPG